MALRHAAVTEIEINCRGLAPCCRIVPATGPLRRWRGAVYATRLRSRRRQGFAFLDDVHGENFRAAFAAPGIVDCADRDLV